MDTFQSFSTQFNPQLYESSNVPPSTDKLFTMSGYQAGLMTDPTVQQPQPQQQIQLQQQQLQQQLLLQQQTFNANHMPPPAPIPSSVMTSDDSSARYSGMYANTGFDMLTVLSRVANRPNPQINLGPVDLSCSFVVVDARQYDQPIVYVSPMFERLTGYTPSEVIGKNCRFLQAPDGRVVIGSRRKYTDNTTVYHIKTHIVQGKESQSSIINYRKTGQPFVNLLTVIPISYESDEIDYFVGLQVDLVEQPNAIFQSMKDGTYTTYYRNMIIPPSMPTTTADPVIEWKRDSPKPSYTKPEPEYTEAEPPMDVETLIKEASVDEGKFKRCWHELLLDESPDFIHVLTIKGIFLYCSESTKQVLEYDPSELVGKSLKAICHPSDITTVMRELKQSSNDANEPVNLIYRVRKKNSGYMWIECCGKLRNEDGRGRKYVVLSGRERSVYQLPRNVLTVGNKTHAARITKDSVPGTEDHEFWGKLSTDGLLLYVSWTCANILGSPPSDIVGMSLYQLIRSNRTTDLTRALAEVKEGKIVYLRHALLNSDGMEVMVATTFYPDGSLVQNGPATFVLMQTRVVDEDTLPTDENAVFVSMDPDVKKKGIADPTIPSIDSNGHVTPIPQRFTTERVIEELDIKRDANWQYELHQLRISNNKLREELGGLLARAKEDGKEETPYCTTCFRRLPGSSELPSEEALQCNTCAFRDLPSM